MLYDPTWKIRFCIVPPKFGLRFHMYPPRWSKRFCMVPPKFPQLGISDIPVISCKNSINKHISNIMYVLVPPSPSPSADLWPADTLPAPGPGFPPGGGDTLHSTQPAVQGLVCVLEIQVNHQKLSWLQSYVAVCSAQCVMYSFKCSMCSVKCAMCSMQYRVCT